MSAAYDNIRAALVTAYLAALTEDVPTAYENAPFTPPDGKPWIKFVDIPGPSSPVTNGLLGTDRLIGILQIDINGPLNGGTEVFSSFVTELRKGFPAGAIFAYNDNTVRVTSFTPPTAGRVVSGFYRKTVEIEYSADVTRPQLP